MTKFGEVPEILTSTAVDLRELTFDQNRAVFTIGSVKHELLSADIYHNLLFPAGTPIAANDIISVPVVLNDFGGPITTPKLFTWLAQENMSGVFQETADIMREVYGLVQGEKLKGKLHKKMDPYGFSCGLIRNGHVTLSVLGSCACLGTNPYGNFVDGNEWETGFVEYEFHNIDAPVQRISLLAGIGHLALLSQLEKQ